MLLSTSVDTVLGEVFADTTSASETIAAGPQQEFMSFVRGAQGHMGAHSTSGCLAEAATASALAQPAARSGLLATWHEHVARNTCLLVALKVHQMHETHIGLGQQCLLLLPVCMWAFWVACIGRHTLLSTEVQAECIRSKQSAHITCCCRTPD